MNIMQSPSGTTVPLSSQKELIADCDIHPVPKSMQSSIYPHLERRWIDYIETYGMPQRSGFTNGVTYPKGQPQACRGDAHPPAGGSPGSDLDFMRLQHLDPHNIGFGVLIPLRFQGLLNLELSTALCSASNDWLVADWLSREPRLKGSVVVPYQDPAASVREIEKRAGDRRFVQVSMLSRTPEPLGARTYWPIYAAAEAAGFPIAVHAFGYGGPPITAGGWPSYYIEEMTSHAQSGQSIIASMVLEGVFEHFPRLKLIVIEGGVAWMASVMWRLDKLWKRLRSETPHLRRLPSDYIREHVWLTSQPIEEPANRQQFVETVDWIGWDRILFASDYPHWDFDDPQHVLPVKLTREQRSNFFFGNAQRAYEARNG